MTDYATEPFAVVQDSPEAESVVPPEEAYELAQDAVATALREQMAAARYVTDVTAQAGQMIENAQQRLGEADKTLAAARLRRDAIEAAMAGSNQRVQRRPRGNSATANSAPRRRPGRRPRIGPENAETG